MSLFTNNVLKAPHLTGLLPEQSPPRRAENVAAICLCCFMIVIILAGCSAASPRFGTATKKKEPPHATPSPTKKPESKSTEKEKTETGSTESSKGGIKRNFRKEKNTAIAPLDQSKLMRHISRYMGVPYKLGGESLDGMDCSGYTMTVYREALGIQLPRTSLEQSKMGSEVAFDQLKFGDLLFFDTTGEPVSHVGIYLGDDLFAHAGMTLGVTISSLQSSYFRERYETARRIIE